MDINIISEKENPLLERKELVVRISHAGPTPTRAEIRKKLIAKLTADANTFILGPLEQRYGSTEAIVKVKIYKKKERAMQIERPHIFKKNFPAEEAPAIEEKKEKLENSVDAAPEKKAEEKTKPEDVPAVEEKKGEVEKQVGEVPKEKVEKSVTPTKVPTEKERSAEKPKKEGPTEKKKKKSKKEDEAPPTSVEKPAGDSKKKGAEDKTEKKPKEE